MRVTAIRENALPVKREILFEDEREFLERRRMPDERGSPFIATTNSDISATGHRTHVAVLEPDWESRGSGSDLNATSSETLRHKRSSRSSRSDRGGDGFSRRGRWCS